MRPLARNRLAPIILFTCTCAALAISFMSGRRSVQFLKIDNPVPLEDSSARLRTNYNYRQQFSSYDDKLKKIAAHLFSRPTGRNLSQQDNPEFKIVLTNTNPSHKLVVLNKTSDLLSAIYLNPPCLACTFEPNLQQIMKKCLEHSKSNDSIFFDIGANIGVHSLYMAALGYNVIAIEADSDTFALFSRAIAENKFFNKILAFNVAVTSTRTDVQMMRNPTNMGNNQIFSVDRRF